jgi:hypothetical protein
MTPLLDCPPRCAECVALQAELDAALVIVHAATDFVTAPRWDASYKAFRLMAEAIKQRSQLEPSKNN